MLVLVRKARQAVIIGDNVRLIVDRIDSNTVRLAFDAPKEIAIDRAEVRERQLREAKEEVKTIDISPRTFTTD